MTKLLDSYIHILELDKRKRETLFEIIRSIIWHKIEGDAFEKKTLIETIKGIDILNKPSELRKLMDNVTKGEHVRCADVYRESILGRKNLKFSKKFRNSLREVLYD
jgi:hypothetical protein